MLNIYSGLHLFFLIVVVWVPMFGKAIYGWTFYKKHNVVIVKQTNLVFLILLFT
jgi:hypothetical protein